MESMNRTSVYWNIYTETARQPSNHKKNKKIPIRKGVWQGNTISPKSLTACLEEVFKKSEWDDIRLKIDGEYLNNLRFVLNDIVLLSKSREKLKTK